jgi:hypothetical protein
MSHETHKLSQVIRAGVDSVACIHLLSKIDHKIFFADAGDIADTSRFADTIEYVMFTQTSGMTEHVTFCSKLFVDT